MGTLKRRQLIRGTTASLLLSDLSCLRALGQQSATETTFDSNLMRFDAGLDPVVSLILNTPRDRCPFVFVKQLEKGLSYQQFLASLFLAAAGTGDLHQIAQIHAAHQISKDARIEERLLPLFWALDRIKLGHSHGNKTHYLTPLKGFSSKSAPSTAALHQGMQNFDRHQAEFGIVAISRHHGPQHAMRHLWSFAARNVGNTLGHSAIGVANATRTLNTIGWNYAEPSLRYLSTEIARIKPDRTYHANLAIVKTTVPHLPQDWTGRSDNQSITLELYNLLRNGEAESSCDFICESLKTQTQASVIWDAINLAAADLIFRYRTGGNAIGGRLIHAATTTNALQFGFNQLKDSSTRLLLLLQAAGILTDYFIKQADQSEQLRDMNLLKDLAPNKTTSLTNFGEIFESLPPKGDDREQQHSVERVASDSASRAAYPLLLDEQHQHAFMQTARSLLCTKASTDPHDMKFPSAIFEQVAIASSEWKPYLLASSLHALHGTQSKHSKILTKVRETLR